MSPVSHLRSSRNKPTQALLTALHSRQPHGDLLLHSLSLYYILPVVWRPDYSQYSKYSHYCFVKQQYHIPTFLLNALAYVGKNILYLLHYPIYSCHHFQQVVYSQCLSTLRPLAFNVGKCKISQFGK